MNKAKNELLLLVAHGSRDEGWSNAFQTMTLKAQSLNREVDLAFMELSSPSIEEVIANAVTHKGITQIQVLPLFLAVGKHLKHDIPEILDTLAHKFNITINLLPPIGEHPLLHQALAEIAQTS